MNFSSQAITDYLPCIAKGHPSYEGLPQVKCNLLREYLIEHESEVIECISQEIEAMLARLEKHWKESPPYGLGADEEYEAEIDLGYRERIELMLNVARDLNVPLPFLERIKALDEVLVKSSKDFERLDEVFPREFATAFKYKSRLGWLLLQLESQRG